MNNHNYGNEGFWAAGFGCFILIFAILMKFAVFIGGVALICLIVKWILF